MMREEVRTKGFAARLYNFCMGKFIGTATVTSTATEADGVVEPVCGGGGEGDGEASRCAVCAHSCAIVCGGEEASLTTSAAQACSPTPPAGSPSAAHVLSSLDGGGGLPSADGADDAALPLLDPESRAVEGLRAMMSNPEKYAAPPVTLTVADAVQIYWLFTRKHRGIGQPLCPELAKLGQPGFYTALASLSAGKFVHVDARECRSLLGVLTSKT